MMIAKKISCLYFVSAANTVTMGETVLQILQTLQLFQQVQI